MVTPASGVDVAVIGGGSIGLGIAWKLRQRGASVAVLERGPFLYSVDSPSPHGQATWASAGILAPLAESTTHHPLCDLGLASLQLYPEFVQALSEATGVEVVLQGAGLLKLGRGPEDTEFLRKAYEWQKGMGLPLEWLEGAGVHRLEPALDAERGPALLSRAEKHLPPRLLLQALTHANAGAGVRLLSNCPAEHFQQRGDRLTAVETPLGTLSCSQVVLAGGCWTGEITRSLGTPLPVRPIRGQILALRCALLLSHTVYTPEGYLVPRADGRLIVGATADDVGFTSAATAEGVQRLLGFATRLIPSLAHAPFDGAWAGLRPGSPDDLPLLGSLPGWSNVHVATGHYRNGILLTPITALLMADWILNRRSDPLLAPCRPERFAEGIGDRV